MIDVKERDRLKENTDKLKAIKASSEKVREWLTLNNELIRQKKQLLNTKENSKINYLKREYIELLTNAVDELSEDPEVSSYIKASEKVLSTLSSRSAFMRGIKSTYPELHAWIALNKKRAYYEDMLLKDISSFCFDDLSELNVVVKKLNEINTELQNFRKKYPDSVEEWEALYKLKNILRQ